MIKSAQAGDQVAFDRLYHRYTDALYRYIYHQCYDAPMAEEVLGELWLRVVERVGQFKPPSDHVEQAFTGWLYRIARNLMIDQYRRRKRHPHVSLPETIESNDAIAEQAEDRANRAEVQAALQKLTDGQRDVVVLRFFEGYTSAEVAEITGRTEYAVKSLQHRALAALERVLRKWKHSED